MSANDQLSRRRTPAGLAPSGALIDVGSDAPFLLEGELAWYVAAGRVDVFAVPVDRGRASGARQHLFRADAGRLLIGRRGRMPERRIALLGVGATGTRLRVLHRAHIERLAVDPEQNNILGELLDDWIDLLCMSMSAGIAPDECRDLGLGEHTADPDAPLRPGARVLWIRHRDGRSRLLGDEELTINGSTCTPLSRRAWFQPQTEARIRVEDTTDILGSEDVWTGLDELHRLVLSRAGRLRDARAAAEVDRLRSRTRARDIALRGACADLATALVVPARPSTGGDRLGIEDGAATDPLLAACRLVGAADGIEIQAPPSRPTGRRDPVSAIARASRIRTRRVLLREDWWHEDGGPFLARLGETGAPVALIPRKASEYLLHDPATGRVCPVTDEVAAELDPRAQTFYRPFPDEELGLRDVLTFGLSRSRRDALVVLLMGIAAGLLGLVTPLATGKIFNDIIPGADRSALLQITLGLVVIAVATGAFNLLRAIALVRIEGKMGAITQSAVWDRLLALPMPFFRAFTAGDLAMRSMGIDAIRQLLSGATVRALLGGLFSVFQYGLLFHYSPRLAAWATLLIAVAVAAALVASRIQMDYERQVAGLRTRLAGTVLQFLSSISKLKVAGAESQAFAIWARMFGKQRRLQLKGRNIINAVAAFNASYPTASFAVLYALALPQMADGGTIRTGDFLAFMAAYTTCLYGMLGATAAVTAALAAIPLYEQAEPVLRTIPEVHVGKGDPGELKGAIELQHVRFRYHPDMPLVLRDVSLRIAPGEYVAFVGPSGSGKSTVLRLLLGFEAPESGAIYYDGQELSGLDSQAVRSQIGVVLQNGGLMAGDIFTNISGSANSTLDEVWEAAAAAGLAEDIKAMPMGMHTVVSEGGGTLSGGQRQRLMIARAIVKKPRLIFFDEATSALDNRTQSIVSGSLDRLHATRIVIAHRLSTILHADRICVIDAGRVVETGSYDQLMAQDGLFATLARRQIA